MFDLTVHQEVFAINVVWAVASYAVAIYYGWRLVEDGGMFVGSFRERSYIVMVLGVFLVAIDSGIHRTWWAAWRWFLSYGDEVTAAWIKGNADWLNLLVIGICYGYACHLWPILRAVFGRGWFVMITFVGFALYVAAGHLAGNVTADIVEKIQ